MSKFEIHDNAEAIRFDGHDREVEARARLEEYTDSELLDMFRTIQSIHGDNEWCDTFTEYEVDDWFSCSSPSDIARAFEGVSIDGLMRYNGNGNIENVTEEELEQEARSYCSDLVWWVVNGYYSDLDLIADDAELFDGWDDIDRADDDEEKQEIIDNFQ